MKKTNEKDRIVNSAVIGFFAPAIAYTILLLIDKYKDYQGEVLWTVAIISAVYLVSSFVQTFLLTHIRKNDIEDLFNAYKDELETLSNKYQSDLDRTTNDFKNLIHIYDSKLAQAESWFYNHSRLADEEKKHANAHENAVIWVATSDLKYETEYGSPILDSIQNNLKAGIDYYYFIPISLRDNPPKDNPLRKFQLFLNKCSEYKGKVYIFTLDDIKDNLEAHKLDKYRNSEGEIVDTNLFHFLTNILVYVYDVNDLKNKESKVFQELRISDDFNKCGWIALEETSNEVAALEDIFETRVKIGTSQNSR